MRYNASWSMWTEFAIVIVGAFGYFTIAGIVSLFNPAPSSPLSASDLQFILVYELILMAILAVFLHARGWHLDSIDMRPDLAGTMHGIGLALIAHFAYIGLWILLASLMPQLLPLSETDTAIAPAIGWGLIVVAMVVNSVFEEVFVTGDVISTLSHRFSPWTAVNVSVAIRLAYHLYQGAPGVVSIISTGLIFALWYARRGTLWPLITAHTLLNLYAFSTTAE